MTMTVLSQRNDETAEREPWWRSLLRPAYLLILIVVAVVAIFASVGSSYQIYIVDTILLASIGAIALDLLMGTGARSPSVTRPFSPPAPTRPCGQDARGRPFRST